MIDAIELLARDDKWFLGDGDAIIFAPPFPVWLDAPGFWDEATVYQHPFAPIFTVTALGEDGSAIPMRVLGRRWTPAELTAEYRLANGVSATEVRTVQPGGIFVSEWRLTAVRSMTLHLVAWTAQDGAAIEQPREGWAGALRFTRTLLDARGVPLRIAAELACTGGASSWGAYAGERITNQPRWQLTPFAERWRSDGLPRELRLGGRGASTGGLVYAAVHQTVTISNNGGAATFAMRLSAADESLIRPTRQARPPVAAGTLGGGSRRRWQEWFARAPRVRCSDPYFETYYYYRWYCIGLHGVKAGIGNYAAPALCEGIASLHSPSALAAPAHVRELRWSSDPERARGVLRTFFTHQRADGSVPGRITLTDLRDSDFFHANWGDAMLAIDVVAPDDDFVREMYTPLARYADWLVRERDLGETGMFDVVDQHETGQPYMSRYQAVDDTADRHEWDNRLRLKGIDATCYGYSLFIALERLAERADADASRWTALAARTRAAVRSVMWDEDNELFSDVDPRTMEPTGVKAAVCFYPYMSDLANASHLAGLERHLLDPGAFWTPFPVPSASVDDPNFSAFGEWKGRRHASAGNGRVRPWTNSHVIEGLARAALAYAPHLRPIAAQLLHRFIRMMFHDGDLGRANCHEHYNPFGGQASAYRGVDDHLLSWVNDLIIRYVMGIRPHARGVRVDPFPFGLELASIEEVRVRGQSLAVHITGNLVRVLADGVERQSELGVAVEVPG